MAVKLPRKTLRWVVILVVTALVVQSLVGPRGFWILYREYRERAQLREAVALEQKRIDSLTLVEQRLQDDPEYIERTAREVLGVSRPGETVIKFVDRE